MSPEERIPREHPLRRIRALADEALKLMSPLFDEMYGSTGRDSIPPERLLKGSMLIALYTLRGERQLCEQLEYNLLFRWFLGMDMIEPVFNHSTFSKNRERLLAHDAAGQFFAEVVNRAQREGLMSSEHFTVDSTLIEAWASLKSFKKKDGPHEPPDDPGNPSVDFHGEKRSNDTHVSTTDPDSRLARRGKGKEAKLSYAEHVLMENRNGLIVDAQVHPASGVSETEAALEMLAENVAGTNGVRTVAGDKGYDTTEFVDVCRELQITPHVAQNLGRNGGSRIDARTTRHSGYTISQRIRKRIEEIFGWQKTVGGFRKTRFRGLAKTQFASYITSAAYNLLRMAKILMLQEATA